MQRTILIALLLPGFAQAETKVTAESLRGLVESGNALVAAAREESAAARRREGYFLRSFFPAVEAAAGYERFSVGRKPSESQPTYGAEASINLFNAGRDWLESESRSLEAEKRELTRRRVLAEEMEKARSLYWEALYLQERILLVESSLRVNEENLGAAERRIRGGVATQSDRFEFEMQSVELRRELANASTALAAQKRNLALRLGLDPLQPLSLPEQLAHDHDYERLLTGEGRDLSPWFKETELGSRQLSLAARSSARAWWPKLDAFASFHQFNEREEEFPAAEDRRESVVGVRLTMSLAAGLESVREREALAQEAKAAELRAGWLRADSGIEVENELADLKQLHAQVHEAEENIKRARRYYDLTQSEYARGVKNSPDVLGAAEKLFAMENKRLEILRDFQVAKSHLLSKMEK